MKKIYFLSALAFLTPLGVFAFDSIQDLIPSIGSLIPIAIPLIFGIALVFFIWGLIIFIFHAGEEKKIEEGKRIMKWGVVALFVMASVWGLVIFLQESFGVGSVSSLPSDNNVGAYNSGWKGQ